MTEWHLPIIIRLNIKNHTRRSSRSLRPQPCWELVKQNTLPLRVDVRALRPRQAAAYNLSTGPGKS